MYTSDLKGLKVCKQTHLTKGESVNRRVCHIKKFHVTRAVVIGGGGGGWGGGGGGGGGGGQTQRAVRRVTSIGRRFVTFLCKVVVKNKVCEFIA